jgi:hypothetical protein
MKNWLSRLAAGISHARSERLLANELNGHLDAHIADNIRAGMTPDDARRWVRFLDVFARDIRCGLRVNPLQALRTE